MKKLIAFLSVIFMMTACNTPFEKSYIETTKSIVLFQEDTVFDLVDFIMSDFKEGKRKIKWSTKKGKGNIRIVIATMGDIEVYIPTRYEDDQVMVDMRAIMMSVDDEMYSVNRYIIALSF